MNSILVLFLMIALPIALFAEWWCLKRAFMARKRVTHAQYRQSSTRADEALAAAKRQIESLQHQLMGARLKVYRMEHEYQPPEAAARTTATERSPLLMPRETADSGFPDTQFGC